jgi:hypothetical protein
MAASATIDIAGAFKMVNLTNGPININTNTGTAGLDISGFTGTLSVLVSVGAGVSGTVIVPSIKAGADTNVSNATNFVLNGTNFANVATNAVLNVDLRASGFGSPAPNATGVQVVNKFMYLTWLITGSATANSALDAWVIGQQKVSS